MPESSFDFNNFPADPTRWLAKKTPKKPSIPYFPGKAGEEGAQALLRMSSA
jgi:hypothetical protein